MHPKPMRAAARFTRFLCCLTGAAVLAFAAGCASDGARTSRDIDLGPVANTPRVVVVRDTKGVRLEWKSIAGEWYVVKYREPNAPANAYQVLPGGANLQGTGGMLRIADPSPRAKLRRYRVERVVTESQGIPLR